MVHPALGRAPIEELKQFHAEWLAIAVAIHVAMSLGIGVVFGLVLPRLRPIPTPLAWGGILLPLLWTAVTFGLMGIVNPLLQHRVDWPWFNVSQFIFGVTAAIVVMAARSWSTSLPRAAGQIPWPTMSRARGGARHERTCHDPSEPQPRRLGSGSCLCSRCSRRGAIAPTQVTAEYRPVPADQVRRLLSLFKETAPAATAPMASSARRLRSTTRLCRHRTRCGPAAVIFEGRPGTPMPAFARTRGGPLTDDQVKALASGLKSHWTPVPPEKGDLPHYSVDASAAAGDKDRGLKVFARACAPCHGTNGEGGETAGAIRNQDFLALISDQCLAGT